MTGCDDTMCLDPSLCQTLPRSNSLLMWPRSRRVRLPGQAPRSAVHAGAQALPPGYPGPGHEGAVHCSWTSVEGLSKSVPTSGSQVPALEAVMGPVSSTKAWGGPERIWGAVRGGLCLHKDPPPAPSSLGTRTSRRAVRVWAPVPGHSSSSLHRWVPGCLLGGSPDWQRADRPRAAHGEKPWVPGGPGAMGGDQATGPGG